MPVSAFFPRDNRLSPGRGWWKTSRLPSALYFWSIGTCWARWPVSGLVHREHSEREFDVYLNTQRRAQPHEVVNDFSGTWAVVEQSGLQHHFFRVETDAFVGSRIVVLTTNRIRMSAREKTFRKKCPGMPSCARSGRASSLADASQKISEAR